MYAHGTHHTWTKCTSLWHQLRPQLIINAPFSPRLLAVCVSCTYYIGAILRSFCMPAYWYLVFAPYAHPLLLFQYNTNPAPFVRFIVNCFGNARALFCAVCSPAILTLVYLWISLGISLPCMLIAVVIFIFRVVYFAEIYPFSRPFVHIRLLDHTITLLGSVI